MGVYKPKGYRYWQIRFTVNKQEIRRSARTTDKKKAQALERKLRQQIEDDLYNNRMGLSLNRTYGEALLKWLESGAPVSMKSHARATRNHLEHVRLIDSVKAAHEMASNMLADGLSVQTINRRLAVVRRILNLAYEQWEWLREPLGKRIKLYSEKGYARQVYLSRAEVTSLVTHMSGEAAIFTLLAAYTGLRRSEIWRLQPGDCSALGLHVRKSKGGQPRMVPLVNELRFIAGTLPFSITDWELRRQFEAAREAIGRPDVRFHDLRHTFASWLVADPSVPITVVRDILGHSHLGVTSRYSHLRGESLQAAIKSLGNNVN